MTGKPLSLLSINQATVREQCSLADVIALCRDSGIGGIAIWRDKLAELGVAKAAAMIADAQLTVTGLCRGGMFPAATAIERRAAIDDNLRAIDDAAALGAQCLVIVAGGLPPTSKDLCGAREMVRDGLETILPHARNQGLPIAIEPLHPMYAADRSCINTLAQALDLCDDLGPGIGVAVDVYHVWWDPDLQVQIARAGDRILAFHVCDWLVPTLDMLLDRGMMGDGVIDIPKIGQWVADAGFTGLTEVEIFSRENWWKQPADTVIKRCVAAYQDFV